MDYTRVNWENLPSTKTPVNATNLNKMDEGIANKVDKVTGKGLSTNDFTNDYKKELDGLNFKIANYTLGNNIQMLEHQTKYNDYMLVVNEQIKTNAIINQYGELIILGDEISHFPNVIFVAVDSNGNTYQLQIYHGGRTCRLLSSNSIPSNVVLGFNCVIIK